MDLKPLISVIIPVKDRTHLLLETLESVKSQTYKNLEIILIDDGSCEMLDDLIKKTLDQYSFKLLRNQESKGPGYSRQKSLEESSGDYVIYLDSDDILHPEMMTKCVEYMEKYPELGMCYVTTREFQKLDDLNKVDQLKIRRRSDQLISENLIYEILKNKRIWETASCCWKKKAVLNFEWPIWWAEDYAYDIQVGTQGLHIGHIAETLCFYRNNEENSSKKIHWPFYRLHLLGFALNHIEASEHIDLLKKKELKRLIFFQFVKWRLRVSDSNLVKISDPCISAWAQNFFLKNKLTLRLMQKVAQCLNL